MSIRILTKSGEQITHIDDARAYNFDAGNKSGIVKGVFNEGNFFASTNGITIDSCELRIAGHRVVIDSAESIALTNPPSIDTRYSMIAEIVVDTSSIPTFRLFVQQASILLRKDNLYKTETGSGIYQLEIGEFTLTKDGNIIDIVRIAEVITGGTTQSSGNSNNIDGATVDSELSLESKNAVQNKVITDALNSKVSLTKSEAIYGNKTFANRPTVGEARLPSEFTEVEYIESTGTQYIDTQYIHKSNTKITLDCFIRNQSLNDYAALFGARNSSWRNNAYVFFYRFSGYFIPCYNRTGAETQGSNLIYNERIKLITEGLLAKWYVDNNLRGSVTTTGTADNGTNNMFLFNCNNGSGSSNSPDQSYSYYKLYNCIFEEDGIIVRDFIPCYVNTEVVNNGNTYGVGTIGLYDLVEGKFYVNQGTGEFLKGKDVLIGSPVAVLDDLKKLNSGSSVTFTTLYEDSTGFGEGNSITLEVPENAKYLLLTNKWLNNNSTTNTLIIDLTTNYDDVRGVCFVSSNKTDALYVIYNEAYFVKSTKTLSFFNRAVNSYTSGSYMYDCKCIKVTAILY